MKQKAILDNMDLTLTVKYCYLALVSGCNWYRFRDIISSKDNFDNILSTFFTVTTRLKTLTLSVACELRLILL